MPDETAPTPLPRIARFEELAYGMFIHWGLYSMLGKGEWIRKLGQLDHAAYDAMIDRFDPWAFDARAIAKMAREVGMRYITLTTRHHDGFSLYDTHGLSTHDAVHSPAKRDLVAEFVEGCRAEGIVPFFYHTTMDWIWQSDTCSPEDFSKYLDYLHASVKILCTQYGEIGGMWFDGNWSRRDLDWKESRLYSMIRRHQPEAMIINNTGLEERGKAGEPEIDAVTFEQGNAYRRDQRGHPKYVAGEVCQTMNAHWGIGLNDFNYFSPAQIIENLARARGVGANYLLNVGPTAEGAIPQYEGAALRRAGDWVALHRDVIYSGRPVPARCQGSDFVLETGGKLYYFAFGLRISGHANVTAGTGGSGPRPIKGLQQQIESVRWIDSAEPLAFSQDGELAVIDLTGYPYGSDLVVRVAEVTVR